MFVDFNILNQLGSPSINSNTFANRPSAGQVGRLFVSTDTFEIYRDNGTGWDLIGGPGSSTVTGSGAAGQVTYWTGTNSVGGENNLWWDAANNHFGINTSTPGVALDVHSAADVGMQLNGTGATPSILQAFLSAGVSQYEIGYNWNSDINYRRFSIYDVQGAKEVISIDQQSRFVGINYQYSSLSDQPAYTFDVSGSGRFADSGYFCTSGGGSFVGVGTTSNPGNNAMVVNGRLQTTSMSINTTSGGSELVVYSNVTNATTNILIVNDGTPGPSTQSALHFGTLVPIATMESFVRRVENTTNSRFELGSVDAFPTLFYTNNVARMAIDATGQVGIGITTGIAGLLHLKSSGNVFQIIDSGATSNSGLSFYANGTPLGAIYYLNATNRLRFDTNATAQMFLTANGNLLVNTSTDSGIKVDIVGDIRTSTGILFGSDTAAANTLDDYEEGTFTPVLTTINGTAPTVGSSQGRYTKIGRVVYFECNLTLSATGSGFTRLFLSPPNGTPALNGPICANVGFNNLATNAISILLQNLGGNNLLEFAKITAAGTSSFTAVQTADLNSNTEFYIYGFYSV